MSSILVSNSMLVINDEVAVSVVWKDSDEFKNIGGMKWFNGETKIIRSADSGGFHEDHYEHYGQYNATYVTETSSGIVIRSQSNPGYLQIGELKNVYDDMPEYDEGVGKMLHDWYHLNMERDQHGYLKPSLESKKMWGMYT